MLHMRMFQASSTACIYVLKGETESMVKVSSKLTGCSSCRYLSSRCTVKLSIILILQPIAEIQANSSRLIIVFTLNTGGA